ncbi:MAG: LPS export ABC transporter periplasmic protein LptC [Desulfuromonadaceae bacterium]
MVFSLGVGIIIFTHQRLEEKEEIIEDVAVEADAALHYFTYTQIEDGEPQWDLEAERGTHDAKRNITNLVEIRAEFFGDVPNESITMTADTAEARLDKETIEARGNVIVVTASGYRLRTPMLEYSKISRDDTDARGNKEADGVIRTSENVDIEADNVRIKGVGMTYKIAPRLLKIHSDVRARIFPQAMSDSRANSTVAAQDRQ